MNAPELQGWTPIHVGWQNGRPYADWCRMGELEFSDPFFSQTIGRALRDPARLLFRRQTPLEALEAFVDGAELAQPRGFIFHVSRCGSTLLAQMLAALPRSVVISEAPPIDQILAPHWRHPQIAREQRIRWLRGMIGAFGQRREQGGRDLFIKFDSWHALELPLIVEAFPTVPWIFLYRDPVEVMVSHHRIRGMQMIPGLFDARFFGLDLTSIPIGSLDEYGARVLARIYDSGLQHAHLGRSRLVNFTELPGAVWESLGAFFGIQWSAEEVARLRVASTQSAKSPMVPHVDDRESKQRDATPEIRRLAHEWLAEPFARLEARRVKLKVTSDG